MRRFADSAATRRTEWRPMIVPDHDDASAPEDASPRRALLTLDGIASYPSSPPKVEMSTSPAAQHGAGACESLPHPQLAPAECLGPMRSPQRVRKY